MTTWAIFKDFRGVLLCEKVDLGIDVWVKKIPARKEVRRFGCVITSAQEETSIYHTVFNPEKYSPKMFTPSAFEPAPEGFTFEPNIRYLTPNLWGSVDVICFITDDKFGQLMHDKLAAFSPDGNDDHRNRDNTAGPTPGTKRIIAEIEDLLVLNAAKRRATLCQTKPPRSLRKPSQAYLP